MQHKQNKMIFMLLVAFQLITINLHYSIIFRTALNLK